MNWPTLDRINQSLERDGRRIQLTPKGYAVLDRLCRSCGQLVTKEDLLNRAWPDVVVGEAVLKVTIRELRKALDDDARAPRYIETVHRRGYRFIGTLLDAADVIPPRLARSDPAPRDSTAVGMGLEGRASALASVSASFDASLTGRRQLLFVTGEAGIGKSRLVDGWLRRAAQEAGAGIVCARGTCQPQFGEIEPYLAVLDALGRLCRGSGAERIRPLLWRYAPGWLLQMPWLIDGADRQRLHQDLFGSTRGRMQRELAELLEALSGEIPVILVIEDLHWSDHATLDLLAYLALREETARLLVLATFRPEEAASHAYPLNRLHQDLSRRGACHTIALQPLDLKAMSTLIRQRLGGPEQPLPEGLETMLGRYSGGNPLFLLSALNDLLEGGALQQVAGAWFLEQPIEAIGLGTPAQIKPVLDRLRDRSAPSEQRLLAAASLIRGNFSPIALAAILEEDPIAIEDQCDVMVRDAAWLIAMADGQGKGAHPALYRFSHAVYRHYWCEQLSSARRRDLQRRLADVLAADGSGLPEPPSPADVAWHYVEGGVPEQALAWLQRAADAAAGRFAPRDAAACLEQMLRLLEQNGARGSSDFLDLLDRRNELLLAGGDLPGAIQGYDEQAALAESQDNAAGLARAQLGLANATFWVDRTRCLAIAGSAATAADAQPDALLRARVKGWQAHWLSIVDGRSAQRAEAYQGALDACRLAGERKGECQHAGLLAYLLISRGDYGQACAIAREGLNLAREIGDGHDFLACQFFLAWGLFYRGQWGEMLTILTNGAEMAQKNGHAPWIAHFALQHAWLMSQIGAHESAESLARPIVAQANAGGSRGSDWLLGLILIARCELSQGRPAAARKILQDLEKETRQRPNAIDWILRLPLQLLRTELYCADRDWPHACAEAEQLLSLADVPNERTYAALGLTRLSEIALARGQLATAEDALRRAFVRMHGDQAPLAAWEAHAAAARLHEARREDGTARHHWRQSAAVLERLAHSMDGAEQIERRFRSQPRIVEIQMRAAGEMTRFSLPPPAGDSAALPGKRSVEPSRPA